MGESKSSQAYVREGTPKQVHEYGNGANPNSMPEERLASISFMVTDFEPMDNALQQVKNVLLSRHKGIEDFSINTQENWSQNITAAISNARLSGVLSLQSACWSAGLGLCVV